MPPALAIIRPGRRAIVNIALKEWAVVIEALASGRQHFLLRKGGIAEGRQGFEVKHSEFLLYPTWEHQQADSIRPEFHQLFEQVKPAQPGVVPIRYLARVSEVFEAPARLEEMRQMDGHHIWSPSHVEMRYRYRPDLPLFIILLRVYRLGTPREIPESRRYAGCRSWVTLDQDIEAVNSSPVEHNSSFDSARNLLLEKLYNQNAGGQNGRTEAT